MLFLAYIILHFSIEKLIFIESRLNHVQRDTFLKRLLGDDEESEFEDDSEDEDWLPGEP